MEQLTHSQFISEIITLIIFGIVYVAILVYCARRDPSGLPQKHKTLRTVIGVFSLLISTFVLVLMIVSLQSGKVNVNSLTELGYNLSRYGTSNPSEIMKETGLGANTIYRGSDVSIVWGYPSMFQYAIRSLVLYFFVFLGLGLYLLLFKRSDTTKGRKVIKVIGFVLLWMTYSGIPSLHYFDVLEIFSIVFVALLSFLCLFVFGRKKRKETVKNDVVYDDNPSLDSIQQGKELLNNTPNKRKLSLFVLYIMMSIPLAITAIASIIINTEKLDQQKEHMYVWHREYDKINDFLGLPNLFVYSYKPHGSFYGYLYCFSISEGFDLSELRNRFSDKNDNTELIPSLNYQRAIEYYPIQEHPILKNKEAYYWKSEQDENNRWSSWVFLLDGNCFYQVFACDKNAEGCDKNMSYLLSEYKIPSSIEKSIDGGNLCYLMICLCLVFWIAIIVFYYFRTIKKIEKNIVNKSALRLSRHVFWCTILWFVGGIVFCIINHSDYSNSYPYSSIFLSDSLFIPIVGIVVFTINLIILRYVTGKIKQQPAEDYLLPQWFKIQNANILKNIGIVRLFLLFLVWPVFVLIPVPFVGAFAIIYVVGVFVILYLIKAVVCVIKWIRSGAKTKVSYKE